MKTQAQTFNSKPWKAGAAQVDITPEMGIQIAGDIGRYRPVEEIRDPLNAKALVIEGDGKRVCIVQVDLAMIDRKHSELIRHSAADRFDLDPDSIMLHATQTHSTPSLGNELLSDEYKGLPPEAWFLPGGDERYHPVAVKGILDAIEKALANLRPISMMAGRGIDGRVSFNRRFIMRDGTGTTHPAKCDPNILHTEGAVDPEVGVMLFVDDKGDRIAALLHHTCHPCHGYPLRWISAGWPGAWARNTQRIFGTQCVSLVLNGFCGNIHHCNHLDPNQDDNHIDMAQKLTGTTQKIISNNMRDVPANNLAYSMKSIKLDRRKLSAAELEAARKLLAKHPEPMWTDSAKTSIHWDWAYAITTMDLAEQYAKSALYEFPVQAIRLGDVAILGIPGEPFVEEQLRIKLRSPVPFTFCAHMANGSAGYIPTERAFTYGGYETRTANWSCLAPDSLTRIGDCAIEMLQNIY